MQIEVVAGGYRGKEFLFRGPASVLIGRATEADVQLPENDLLVSRRHAMLTLDGAGCRLVDLNSRNGLRVNGRPTVEAELMAGDQLQVGDSLLQFQFFNDTFSSEPSSAMVDLTRSSFVQSLEGYVVHEEIGQGAIATVYRATRQSDGAGVAIKLIHGSGTSLSAAAERLRRETIALQKLRHPHIVSMLEVGEFMQRPYVVMEHAAGGDLGKRMERQGTIAYPTAVAWICQALEAIELAHANQIVHRDIKPENLLLFSTVGEEIVKVADFGHALVQGERSNIHLTVPGEVNGTPRFMAPEQVIQYSQAPPSVDQYGMAAVLYYLVTGHYAFDFPSDTGAMLAMLLQGTPVPIKSRGVALPSELGTIIHRALSHNPSDRFVSAAAFRQALLPFKHSRGETSKRPQEQADLR